MNLDDWMERGPEVYCCDCGCGLGRLNDERGVVVGKDLLCEDCAEEAADADEADQ